MKKILSAVLASVMMFLALGALADGDDDPVTEKLGLIDGGLYLERYKNNDALVERVL